MRAQDWQRASHLFERALDIASDERTAWLATECTDDADLLRTVTRWLAADAAGDDFLERPLCADVLDGSEEDANDADADIAGTMFGAYRALRPIGAGGMGEVWLAARADGEFEQQVAIKRLLYPTPELVRRFRHERRVLAGLQHPHIAQLHGGGVGADGAPYFVMEYVKGEPITVYSDAHHCGLNARIDLILQVCEAVQYAHRNLIVHRDLKPSNVLVDADDQVKLLDFGIAKVLESTDGSGQATATLVQRMTPDYAAPEQMRGEVVTTATDVYALGVLLFELLAGERPYKAGRQRGELDRAIVATAAQSASTVAARSDGISHEWARRLRGDLDRIIAKAMAKEPERRYASAEALADDLRRYLSGRPVIARGDDAGYRLRKFVGRNRASVVAVVAIALALITATAISLYQARIAHRQAQRADAEKTFVLGILDANDPNETQGGQLTLTAREILDRAAARIDKDLANQPSVRAELYDEIGNLYWDYGLFEHAQPLFEHAVALAETAGMTDQQRAAFLIDLGADQQVQRHLVESEAAFRQALTLARAGSGDDSTQAGDARAYLSETLTYAGRFGEAEAFAREAIARVGRHHARDSTDYADATDRLAFTYFKARRFRESVAIHRDELAIYERAHPGLHSSVSSALNDLGNALLGAGELSEAESAFRRALGMHEQLLGKGHPHYAATENNLGRVVDLAGRFEEARVLLDDALERSQHVLGPDSLALDANYRRLAQNADRRADFALAETDARRALSLDLKAYGAANPLTVESNLVLGEVLSRAGKFEEAEHVLRETVATSDHLFGDPNDASGYARALLARTLARSNRVADATPLFVAALADLRSSVGEKHYEYANALVWQGEAELMRGDAQRAEGSARQAVAAARAAYPAGDALIADSLFLQARVCIALARSADAVPLLHEVLSLRRGAFMADDTRIAEAEQALQQIAVQTKKQ